MRFIKFQFQLILTFFLLVSFLCFATDAQDNKESGAKIKIGLLIPDSKSTAAKNGAELAIRTANERGGANGLMLELVVRSMEGPWGTGSKAAVSLIFEDNVAAILGSHDGRNAHLAEQATAKSQVVFLSAWSDDPSLSQAFVPWFFNCVYNNIQQSDALIKEIYDKRKPGKIAVISDNGYDSGSALKNFLKRVESEGKPEPVQLLYNDTTRNFRNITDKLRMEDIDCIILLVEPPASVKIIGQLRLNNLNQPVYCYMAQLDENKIPAQDFKIYDKVIFVSTENFKSKPGNSFYNEYSKNYGASPGAVAACAFDGMNILIEAIKKAGTEREKIQKAISGIKYEGVTGTIQFDEKGNRKGTPGFVEIKYGIPVSVKR